jgi:colanic acid/amylovoran biosynthesis glycosyltransferase
MVKPNLILFSSLLLPPSQTFIRAQGEQIQQFTPHYVGSRIVPGLELPPERTLVINQGTALGKVEEQLFKLTGFAPSFYRRVQQLKPVLIHAQFGLSGALAMPLARSLQLPLIVHFRGADATLKDDQVRYTSINQWVYLQRREKLKQETRLFLTVSNFIKEALIAQKFPSEKVRVHYSGINIQEFTPDPAIPREQIVLFVGRLTEKKGCEYLIQAMQRIQATRPNTHLVLIGDGPLLPSLQTLAAQTLKKYQFLGVQPASVVKQWMNRAYLLVAPSITAIQGDSEGLPNVVLEAQAMGLPVVSTLHAGIPEGVIHGETGFLAAERDAEQLASHCLTLIDDISLWQRFSQRGQGHVRENFDRAKQTVILEEIYRSILRGEL